MGAFLKIILGLLIPPDPSPWDLVPGAQDQNQAAEAKRSMRRWQVGISAIVGILFLTAVGSVFTPYGFALAADAKRQATEAVKPLEKSISLIEKKALENELANIQTTVALNELRAVAVANNIDRLIRRRCIETEVEELQSLRRDIEVQKMNFYNLARTRYTEPSCAEVRR